MNFKDLKTNHPVQFARAKDRFNDARLAELLDRGATHALGEYVQNVFDTTKFDLEQSLAAPSTIEWPPQETSVFALPQAD